MADFPVGKSPVLELALLGLGSYLMWFGVHYWRDGSVRWPVDPLKSVLQGKPLPAHTETDTESAEETDILTFTQGGGSGSSGSGGSGGGGSATDSAIANDALQYVGHAYVYGGAPGPDGKGGWDCSSFVNYVLGHDLGMSIPGGSWSTVTDDGNEHGPDVSDYVLWTGATTVSSVAAGDLILFPPNTHMGIATDGTNFVSAEDPQDGTAVAPISAGPGAWIARRISAAT
jgi:cell wall-associated NlpC family hydrolase